MSPAPKPEFCYECSARADKLATVDSGYSALCVDCLSKLLASGGVFECDDCHILTTAENKSEYEVDEICRDCYETYLDPSEDARSMRIGYFDGL